MKLLENSGFESLNNALCITSGDNKIVGRLESYTTKLVGPEKQLYRKFIANDGSPDNDLIAVAPNSWSTMSTYRNDDVCCNSRDFFSDSYSSDEGSCFIDIISRKTLFYLIATLNAAFPDYDFSDAKSHEFNKESDVNSAMNSIDSNLSRTCGAKYRRLRSTLWTEINKVIPLKRCAVYSYTPDLNSDPFSEDGCLWSFNYFFLGKRARRMVFFTCRASSITHSIDSGVGSDFTVDDNDEDDEEENGDF